ncbi:cubilin [Aplysia californica]|uniref:Cubilin n=1 Tax=Aplysia californica TaxID=6500 RepID=A0ABM0K038_APLCA|nr:cubilin [Aplysia californica]
MTSFPRKEPLRNIPWLGPFPILSHDLYFSQKGSNTGTRRLLVSSAMRASQFTVTFEPSPRGGKETVVLLPNRTSYVIPSLHYRGGLFNVSVTAAIFGASGVIEKSLQVRAACLEEIHVISGTIQISAPNQLSGNYLPNVKCRWVVTSPPGSRLRLDVDHVKLRSVAVGSDCGWDMLRLYLSSNHWTLCDSGRRVLATTNNSLVAYFLSKPGPQRKPGGFLINVTVLSFAPQHIQITKTAYSFVLSWQPPSDDVSQDPLLAYHVTYSVEGGVAKRVLLSPYMLHFSLATPQYGRLYTIEVGTILSSGREITSPVITQRASCGHNVTRSSTVSSPGFPHTMYKPHTECTWTISKPPNVSSVTLNFTHIDLQPSPNCQKDFLEIEGLGRLCGAWTHIPPLTLKSDTAGIRFVTDSSGQSRGFQIDVIFS